MKALILTVILSSPFYFGISSAESMTEKKLSEAQKEQIMLLRSELEFLALKLLKITNESNYSIQHPGHNLVHFGVCGKGVKGGFKVNCVTPNTAAHKIGLKPGDIVTNVNKVSLSKLNSKMAYERYSEIVKRLNDGDDIAVEYLRDNTHYTGAGTIKSIFAPGYYFRASNKKHKTE